MSESTLQLEIPILLPGIEPSALPLWFEKEPLALPISLDPGALQESLPGIMRGMPPPSARRVRI